MFVAGIDAHTTYSVIAIVSNAGELVCNNHRSGGKGTIVLLGLIHQFTGLVHAPGKRIEYMDDTANRFPVTENPLDPLC